MNDSSSKVEGEDHGKPQSNGGATLITGGDDYDDDSVNNDDNSSDDDGGFQRHNNRKRKKNPSEAPTAAEEAASVTLMSLPKKLYHKKDLESDASSKDRTDPDLDLSTIEGQQALNPNMSIEEARFQVSCLLHSDCGSRVCSLVSFFIHSLCFLPPYLCVFLGKEGIQSLECGSRKDSQQGNAGRSSWQGGDLDKESGRFGTRK